MKNFLIGALFVLFVVACSAAAVEYVTEDDHAYDVNQLHGRIDELEYRLLLVESTVFGPPLSGPPYTFNNGGPR